MECLEKFADTPDKKVQIEDSRNSSLMGRENSEEWYPDNHVMQGEALLPPFKTQYLGDRGTCPS